MGEGKRRETQRTLQAVEQRAALNSRQVTGSRIRDRFGRGIHVGDGVLLAQSSAYEVVWRVGQQTPATEPQFQGGIWVDVVAHTRVLCRGVVPNPEMVLVLPVQEAGTETEEAPAAPTPTIVLTDTPGD
jgi:hypothetical protein